MLYGQMLMMFLGGYDPRVLENVAYYNHLVNLCANLRITAFTASSATAPRIENSWADHPFGSLSSSTSIPPDTSVIFLLSIPTSLKSLLLRNASLLVYTPRGEHFGIVPLEAMAAGVPVLAANEGGPVESVVNNVTGWLCIPDIIPEWTHVMAEVIKAAVHRSEGKFSDLDLDLEKVARAGKERVRSEFSREKMARRLDEELRELRELDLKDRRLILNDNLVLVGIVGVVVLAAVPWFFLYQFI